MRWRQRWRRTTTFTDEPAANHDEPHPTTLTYAILFKDPVTDEDVVAIADAMLHRGISDYEWPCSHPAEAGPTRQSMHYATVPA